MKPASMFISFLLCLMISIFIVIHSYLFLREHIESSIALLIAVVIETCFISYSIMGAILGRWTKMDSLIKISLFFLSVIPATMQTSQKARTVFVEKVALTSPSAPQNISTLTASYENQLSKIDDEISALRQFKTTYNINKTDRTWYAYQDQKRIDNLMKSREKIDAEKKQIELDYFNKLEAYNQKNAEFIETKTKFSYEAFFDIFFMLWTVLVVWILQIVNGRLSGAISAHIANHTVTEDDDEKLPISPELLWMVSKFQSDGMSLKDIKKILIAHSIFQFLDLKEFLDSDFKKIIRKKYASKKQPAVLKLFDGLKEELNKPNHQTDSVNQTAEKETPAPQTTKNATADNGPLPSNVLPA